jgi:hypothetical protein
MLSKSVHKPLTPKAHEKIRASNVSERAKVAVAYLLENGGKNKGEALRYAGYSEAIVKNPHVVFNSPAVQTLFGEINLDVNEVVHSINKKRHAKRYKTVTVPLYAGDVTQPDGKDSKIETSSLNDGQLIAIFEATGAEVMAIDVRSTTRVVWLLIDDTDRQKDAEKKIIDIIGINAPKRVDMKADVVHQFSLSSLRKQMDDEGIEIIQPKVHEID